MDPLNLCSASNYETNEQCRPQFECWVQVKRHGWMSRVSTETKWHSASTTSHGRLQATQPSPPIRTRAFGRLRGRHSLLICAEISSVRRDQTGRTTSDPVSPCSWGIACPSTIMLAYQKICKYIGTFFSWDTDNCEASKRLTCCVQPSQLELVQRKGSIRSPCSLIPWLPLARKKDQDTECAVERTMVPSSIMEDSFSVQSLDELAHFEKSYKPSLKNVIMVDVVYMRLGCVT
jgi:hypothetical protein